MQRTEEIKNQLNTFINQLATCNNLDEMNKLYDMSVYVLREFTYNNIGRIKENQRKEAIEK